MASCRARPPTPPRPLTAVLDVTKGWIEPQPGWSEMRTALHYGFGRLGLSATPAAFTLAYDFVDKDGVVRDHFSIVKTRK